MSRRRQRTPHPIARVEVVRAILADVRTCFATLPLKQDASVIKFLRAALHSATKEPTYSGSGRPPRWSRETLRAVPSLVESCLRNRGADDLSFSSFVKHYCPLLTFPSDVLTALEADQITLFEAEQLARVVPGRFGLESEREAKQKRKELMIAHLRSHGTSNALRQRISHPQNINAAKDTLKSLTPDQSGAAEIQREIDEYAEQLEKMDYTFLFVDELTYIVQHMLQIDAAKLADTDVDRLLAKLDDVVTVVRELVAKSKR